MTGSPPPDIDTTNLLADAAAQLAQAGVEAPAREARLILALATGAPPYPVPARIGAAAAARFAGLIARRAAREPFAHLAGAAGFWTLDLLVSPATLIPRADSETLIEAAARECAAGTVGDVLDLGTGTGCLLLAALSVFGGARGVGVDLRPEAAALAAANAARNGLAGRAVFFAGDWAAALRPDLRFDLVLSNPPYIPSAEIGGLMPEVARHEPASALDGGADGLAAYRVILALLPRLLREGGVAILELGQGQAAEVAGLAATLGFACTAHDDLGGIARALVVRAGAGAGQGPG